MLNSEVYLLVVKGKDGEREDTNHHSRDPGEEGLPPPDTVDEDEGDDGGDHLHQTQEDGRQGRAELTAEPDLPEDVVCVVDDVGLPGKL